YKPNTPSAETERAPLLLGWTDEDLTRLPLSAMSRGFLLRFPRPFRCAFVALRLRLLLRPRADDRRLPALCFECLAKFVRLRIWTKAFCPATRQLMTPMCRARRRAGKTRGAVPAGQEFVFANLGPHRQSVSGV